MQLLEQAKVVADVGVMGTAVATVTGWLPPLAALLTCVWLGLQISQWVRQKRWKRDK